MRPTARPGYTPSPQQSARSILQGSTRHPAHGWTVHLLIPCFVQSDIPVETVPIPCSRFKSSLIPEKQGTDIFINFIKSLQVSRCQIFG